MLSYSSLAARSRRTTDARGPERRATPVGARAAWRTEVPRRHGRRRHGAAPPRPPRLPVPLSPVEGVIVAVDGGEIVAATSVDNGATIADPFKATTPVVALLELRAEHARPRAQRTTLLSMRRLRARGATAS